MRVLFDDTNAYLFYENYEYKLSSTTLTDFWTFDTNEKKVAASVSFSLSYQSILIKPSIHSAKHSL